LFKGVRQKSVLEGWGEIVAKERERRGTQYGPAGREPARGSVGKVHHKNQGKQESAIARSGAIIEKTLSRSPAINNKISCRRRKNDKT